MGFLARLLGRKKYLDTALVTLPGADLWPSDVEILCDKVGFRRPTVGEPIGPHVRELVKKTLEYIDNIERG